MRYMKLIATMIIAFFVSSCIDYNEELKVNADGSFNVKVTYSMDKSFISMMPNQESLMKTDPQSLLDELGPDSGATVNSIVTNVTNEKFQFTADVSFKDINKIPQKWIFSDRVMKFENEGGNYKLIISIAKTNETNQEVDNESKAMMNSMFAEYYFRLSVIMPGSIKEFSPTNGVLTNGAVVWKVPFTDYMNMKNIEYTVVSGGSAGDNVMLIIFGIIGVIVVAFVLLMVLKGRK